MAQEQSPGGLGDIVKLIKFLYVFIFGSRLLKKLQEGGEGI